MRKVIVPAVVRYDTEGNMAPLSFEGEDGDRPHTGQESHCLTSRWHRVEVHCAGARETAVSVL